MKIEEAILYCLVSQNRWMRTEQIAEMINRQRLHIRKDGKPVTSKQVYAVVCRYPEPTNEREQNQACLCYAERGEGRRSQLSDADGANSGNDKPPAITYP